MSFLICFAENKSKMAKFDLYAPILKKLEGGFVDDPDDAGGATMAGVTLATFRTIFGKNKTVEDLKNITDAQWKKIMKVYWDACNADKIENQSIANIVVDWNINSGADGRKGVQKALGLVADGIFGKLTLAALNGKTPECIHCKIRRARINFYDELVQRKPSQKKFYKGWMNRINTFVFEP